MDIRLHYVEKGCGEVLILLHGNGEDGIYFEHQIEYFSKYYRVIAIDSRGHGKSPRGNAPLTIRQLAQDLKAFMDGHGIKKAHILGFSDGGNVALVFALKYPDMVQKLILNGANLNARGVKASVQIPVEIGYRVASLFAKRSRKAQKNAEILGLMVNEPNVKPEELGRLQNETLVIAGTKDMIKDSHTKLICDKLPHARLVLVEGDHFIANKKWEAFNKETECFLRE